MKKRLELDKAAITVILLNFIEVAVLAAVLLYFFSTGRISALLSDPWLDVLLLLIPAAVVFNTISALRNRSVLLQNSYSFRHLQESLDGVEKLNHMLRAQRHDFMNHLQVVYSLIEMEEFKSAAEYIERVYGDIQKVSRILKTANPAVNALLQAKLINCERAGITVELNITTQLKDLIIPSWEYCRVLGNLLDNAIYVLIEKAHDMKLGIDLSEDLKSYRFRVTNNASPIPSGLLEKIFEPGFTTKGRRGEGMGLAIGREIMEHYGGALKAVSGAEKTSFEASVPR